MSLLYITADKVGLQTGGGLVTHHESEALKSLGACKVWDRAFIADVDSAVAAQLGPDPWCWDNGTIHRLLTDYKDEWPSLCHVYAGTFSQTVGWLQQNGCKVAYTAAAHSIEESRREHEYIGIPYNFPHLNEPELWAKYVEGYLGADAIVCPSTHSADVMRSFGATNRIEVIPHGCEIPQGDPKPPPKDFRVGYLGAVGPDKGLVYLLQAWKSLGYRDATLVLGGRDSQSPFVQLLIRAVYGNADPISDGRIELHGWFDSVADFYDDIGVYVQPSVSEGFGCEVLEAAAHGRPVICSTGAGAADIVPVSLTFPPRDVQLLASKIDESRHFYTNADWHLVGNCWREIAERYTWDKIRARYVSLWKELLG